MQQHLKEYRKYFEKDAAMQRRFQPVKVDEPTVNEALQILRGIKEKLETHHNVTINDSALVSAAKNYQIDILLIDFT